MKKFVALWTTVFTALVLMLCLVGCKTGTAGAYRLYSIRVEQGSGEIVEYRIGDYCPDVSRTLTKSMATAELGEDGKFTLSASFLKTNYHSGTWEQNEDGNIVVDLDGREQVFPYQDGILTIRINNGMILKMKK